MDGWMCVCACVYVWVMCSRYGSVIHTYIDATAPRSQSHPLSCQLMCVALVCVRAAEIQYTANHKPFSHRILRSFTCHWNSVYLTSTTYYAIYTHTCIQMFITRPASEQRYLWGALFRKIMSLLLFLVCVGGRFAQIIVFFARFVALSTFFRPKKPYQPIS